MQNFEIPVEEVVTRRFVHKVEARDLDHARHIVESLEDDGIPLSTIKLRKTGIKEAVRKSSTVLPFPLQQAKALSPVSSIVGMSNTQLRDIAGPIVLGDLEIDTSSSAVLWNGVFVKMTMPLYRILLELSLKVDHIVSRDELLDALSEDFIEMIDRAVDNKVRYMRREFKAACPNFDAIETCHGYGYRLRSDRLGVVVPATGANDIRLDVDVVRRRVTFCGVQMDMPRAQLELLAAMARRPRLLMSTEMVVKYGCPMTPPGADGYGAARTALNNLRNRARKIRSDVPLLENVYGVGARINPEIKVSIREGEVA